MDMTTSISLITAAYPARVHNIDYSQGLLVTWTAITHDDWYEL